MTSLPRVIQAEYRSDYRIHLTFNDGVESTVDFATCLQGPVFSWRRSSLPLQADCAGGAASL